MTAPEGDDQAAQAAAQAAAKAHQNNVCSDTTPSATQNCPLMRRLELGCFFDGTDNNKYNPDYPVDGDGYTNIPRLYDIYSDKSAEQTKDSPPVDRDKHYLAGVGGGEGSATVASGHGAARNTKSGPAFGQTDNSSADQSLQGNGQVYGGGGGDGMKDRCARMYAWVKAKALDHYKNYLPASKVAVDVYGFSRGATEARTFVNLIAQAIRQEDAPLKDNLNVYVRFVGIFDTVWSERDPSQAYTSWDSVEDQQQNVGLKPGDYATLFHFTARDEHRANFALWSCYDAASDTEYPGVHADIGGGYADGPKASPGIPAKSNAIQFLTLRDMWKHSKDAGVAFLGDPPNTSGVDLNQLSQEAAAYSRQDTTAERAAHNNFNTTYVHDSAVNTTWTQTAGGVNDPSPGNVRVVYKNATRWNLAKKPPDFSWTNHKPNK